MRNVLSSGLVALAAISCGPCPQRAPAETPAGAAAGTVPATQPDPLAQPPGSKNNPVGGMCGGLAGYGCAAGLYCSYAPEATCGAADQTGTCAAVPAMCTEEFAPVCGCDDKTYPNACHAARASVSVAKKGECAPAAAAPATQTAPVLAEGQTCGTRGVPGDCGEGLYCAFRQNCGADDTGGVCTKRPQMCTKQYEPVCGCDGKTHGNPCTAASAGVAIAAKGECKPAK
jgi:hypothetical protein